MAKTKVRYTGLSDIREITVQQLKDGHGVDAPEDLLWHRGNNWALTFDPMPEDLEKVLRDQVGEFRFEKVSDDGSSSDADDLIVPDADKVDSGQPKSKKG